MNPAVQHLPLREIFCQLAIIGGRAYPSYPPARLKSVSEKRVRELPDGSLKAGRPATAITIRSRAYSPPHFGGRNEKRLPPSLARRRSRSSAWHQADRWFVITDRHHHVVAPISNSRSSVPASGCSFSVPNLILAAFVTRRAGTPAGKRHRSALTVLG